MYSTLWAHDNTIYSITSTLRPVCRNTGCALFRQSMFTLYKFVIGPGAIKLRGAHF